MGVWNPGGGGGVKNAGCWEGRFKMLGGSNAGGSKCWGGGGGELKCWGFKMLGGGGGLKCWGFKMLEEMKCTRRVEKWGGGGGATKLQRGLETSGTKI